MNERGEEKRTGFEEQGRPALFISRGEERCWCLIFEGGLGNEFGEENCLFGREESD